MGRDEDLAIIRAFVSEAQGGTLLLSGDPGVGKSALLDAAEEMAAMAGIQVLRARGSGSEDASFSGLNQLLLPIRGGFNRLDGLQRDALNGALGFSEGPAGDPLVVSNATLSLLCQSAAERPLLLIVDNLQWMDRASATVLGLAARRLAGSGVALIAAERTGEDRLFDLDVPSYEVLPLDDDAAVRLVADSFPGLAASVRQRIVAEARGNSLALLELPARLSDLQRSGLAALPAVLPLSSRLKAAFSARVSAVPAGTRYLLLLAVLDGTGDLSLLRAAVAEQCEVDLDTAEEAGLVRVDEAARRLIFSHPLFRSVVMELSTSGDMRRGHLALARQLGDQPERQAWHLAAAAVEPEQGAASLLEQVARQMQDRGDATPAVTMLIRAAQLSPHHRDRSRLLAEAAFVSATVTGELSVVPQLLAEARRAVLDPARPPGPEASLHAAVADACLLLDGAADIDSVHRTLADAIRAWPAPPQGAGTALVAALHQLLTVCAVGGRPELWERFDLALTGLAPDGRAELELLARTHADPARSALSILSQLDAAIADLSGETSQWRTLVISAAAARTDRLAGCRAALGRVARNGREGGAVLPALSALTLLSLDGFLSGSWDEAWQVADECLRACRCHGHSAGAWMAREHLAMIAAARGDDELVRELTGDMLQWAMPRGIVQAQMAVHRAGSLAALGRGDFEEAYREAVKISPPGILASHVPHAVWAVMDLVEAAVRTGRHREAVAHVAAAREARISEISSRVALLVSASAALSAPAGRAGRLFEQALDIRGADRWPFELARVQLAFGEHLRRVRAPGAARVQLGAALATFRALGAQPWAKRAANELRAARLIPARTEGARLAVLTSQERQIASLAAAGLTNRQIGERLYLSPRTVGSHLYRVFPKLGVSSRAGLRDALTAHASGGSGREVLALSGPDSVLAG